MVFVLVLHGVGIIWCWSCMMFVLHGVSVGDAGFLCWFCMVLVLYSVGLV